MLACNPSEIDMPAGSSAPELILEPDDNWNRVFCKLVLVIANWFCASREGILFKMLNDIRSLLSSLLVSVLGRRTRGQGPVVLHSNGRNRISVQRPLSAMVLNF